MTKFSKVLNDLIAEHGITQTSLAEVCQIDQVKISRLVNSQARPGRNDLAALLVFFSTPDERYRIARAHLSDELPQEALDILEIQLLRSGMKEVAQASFPGIPQKMEQALNYLIKEYPGNPGIGDVMIDLAAALGWKPGIVASGILPKKTGNKINSYPRSQDTSSIVNEIAAAALAVYPEQKPAPPKTRPPGVRAPRRKQPPSAK